MKKLLRNKKGFTLIELIVVILILAVLAAILVPSIMSYVKKAEDNKNLSNARTLFSELSIKLAEGETLTSPVEKGGVKCVFDVDNDTNTFTSFECFVGTGTDSIYDGLSQ